MVNLADHSAASPRVSSEPAIDQSELDERVKTKTPPVCRDDFLKESAMSTKVLSQLVFSTKEAVHVSSADSSAVHAPEAIPVSSSSSSTCTPESDGGNLSDFESGKSILSTPNFDRSVSVQLNAKVSLRTMSRQGRSSQRWVADTKSKESIRLTTGCVPILRDGQILFVSASRKPEWILPKGGWEMDESIEESAVRECFEEAGVLGILGPKLTDVQYEPRKAKKRRLEREELVKRLEQKGCESESDADKGIGQDKPDEEPSNSETQDGPLSNAELERIRNSAMSLSKNSDECLSVASTQSGAYSQVRMTLFPLYVSSVADSWPESGRFRKAVHIDEAISMLESRPELQAALLEVRRRGLHIISDPISQISPVVS